MGMRKALGIGVISEMGAFALSLINVVVVSRLLRPDEIGIFSVAVSLLALAHIFREFGVGQYLVQAKTVGRQQLRAAFTVALCSGVLIALILFLLRLPLAKLYGHDGIAEVLALLALNFLILPFGTPLLSMMRRDLQFDKLAWFVIFGSLIQTAVTLFAAWRGESYLSMAWGSIASHVCGVLLLNLMRPGEIFVMPTRHGLREVLRFGSIASSASIVKQLGGSAPDLVLGRTLGFAEVAIFSRGVGLQRMIIDRIYDLVRSVHFPTFAGDVRAGGNAGVLYARTVSNLVAVTGPVLAILAILAEPLILFVFGDQWVRSVQVGAVICVGSLFTTAYSLYGLSLTATGHVGVYMRAEVIAQTVRVGILLTSFWFKLEYVVLMLLLAYLVEAFVAQYALRNAFGLSFVTLVRYTWRSFMLVPFSSVGPAAIVALAGEYLDTNASRLAVLVFGGFLGGFGWWLGAWLLRHPMLTEVCTLRRKFSRFIWSRPT